jgi:flagellar basal body-associated protein FliL
MSPVEILVMVLIGVPVTVYLVVRFGAAAFFKSKQQYDNQQRKADHGTSPRYE